MALVCMSGSPMMVEWKAAACRKTGCAKAVLPEGRIGTMKMGGTCRRPTAGKRPPAKCQRSLEQENPAGRGRACEVDERKQRRIYAAAGKRGGVRCRSGLERTSAAAGEKTATRRSAQGDPERPGDGPGAAVSTASTMTSDSDPAESRRPTGERQPEADAAGHRKTAPPLQQGSGKNADIRCEGRPAGTGMAPPCWQG